MARESKRIPEQTSGPSSLSPEERRVYKKILWGFFGFYTVGLVIMSVVAIGSINSKKSPDVVVTGAWGP
jgi:hypothetical protein